MISDALLEIVGALSDPRQSLPAEVETRTRWLLLDTLGCAVAGSRAPEVGSWLDRHHLARDPFATHVGSTPEAVGPVMALTMGACWDEACEGHAGAHGRPGVAALGSIWPGILGMTLGEAIRATLIGYEIGARMGALLQVAPGMHVDANWPSLGAAAAAASALGLDPEGIVTAVGIAACQLPASLYRPVQTGATARNTYLGHSALLGRMAAECATVGITAPRDAVESFARTAYGRDVTRIPSTTGVFEVLDGYFKEYAAVRHVHYAARCAALMRDSVAPERIVSIDLLTYPDAIRYCAVRNPRSPLQAQFSLSFGIAAMLRWGRLDHTVYRRPEFTDPLMRRLEDIVVLAGKATWTDQRTAVLRVELDDGRIIEESVSAVRGDPSIPWSESALAQKFMSCCSDSLSPTRSRFLCEHLLHGLSGDRVFEPG